MHGRVGLGVMFRYVMPDEVIRVEKVLPGGPAFLSGRIREGRALPSTHRPPAA